MVAMKDVLPHTNPYFVATIRLVPAGVLVLLVALWLKRSQPQGWKAWGWISLFALVDGTFFQGCLAAGLERTGAGLGSTLIDSQPLVVALLSSWLFAEVIGLWGWLGLAIGLTGIGLISAEAIADSFSHWENGLAGELWMLLAALSMAVGTVLIRYVAKHVDPVVATGWHMVLGGIPLTVLALWGGETPWVNLGLQDWLDLSYASVFGSAIAYGVFFYLAAQGNLTSLSALTFLTPVFALSFSTLLLGESLKVNQWAGVGLTLVSIYLVNQRFALDARLQKLLSRGKGAQEMANSGE